MSPIRVVEPRDGNLCGSSDPWRDGKRVLRGAEAVHPGDCFAVEFDLGRKAHVFLLSYPVDQELVRLLPANCEPRIGTMHSAAAGETVRFPAAATDRRALFGWHGAGLETFYAVAATDLQAAEQVDRSLRRLPDWCEPAGRRELAGRDFDNWRKQLDDTLRRLGDRVAWQAVRVRHAQR